MIASPGPGGRSRDLMPAIPFFAIVAAMHLDGAQPVTRRAASFIYIHGVYFQRALREFDYARLAQNMAAQMRERLPVVVDVAKNPKWIGFHLEAALRRPVYAGDIADFEEYYFVTRPEDAGSRHDWVMQRREAAGPEAPPAP